MKTSFSFPKRKRHALTLIELLLLVFIIFILGSMTMSVIPRPGRPHKVGRAKTEVVDLANAIQAYQSQYGRYPISTNAEASALAHGDDLTCGGPMLNAVIGSATDTPLNADVLAILMDMTQSPDGTHTVNSEHSLNPKQTKFLNAKLSGTTNLSGVGNDIVYRDPWGHPYIITMDLNGDGWCRDVFYKKQSVSRNAGAAGFNGLTNIFDANGASDTFEFQSKVMVWSLGPDGKADSSKPANVSPNKDNILSWD